MLDHVQDHFHSQAFSGLVGGAVEVYGRSEPWGDDGVPRPIDRAGSPGAEVQPAQITAVVIVAGAALARAVRDEPAWADYLRSARTAAGARDTVFVVRKKGYDATSGTLTDLLGDVQALANSAWDDSAVLGRELSQVLAQHIGMTEQIKVFVSHTKSASLVETSSLDGPHLFERVRAAIARTHLGAFFDAQDIQPGDDWAAILDRAASSSALLMVRTDHYAGREWTQREVFEAKRHDVPIVTMYALSNGEERGSFLMDHVPSVPCDLGDPDPGIDAALNRLVDEALKRALWLEQEVYLRSQGFDWLPVHAPEPVTLGPWLQAHRVSDPKDQHLWIMHPDPPLGQRERQVVTELCEIAGYTTAVDVLTPRTFANRGGNLPR